MSIVLIDDKQVERSGEYLCVFPVHIVFARNVLQVGQALLARIIFKVDFFRAVLSSHH